ncbi:MAG: leucine--tRNA ligase [Planctomycetes bacterium]|nr:leucine--tRNA ligase [Planctomycetota bacterium]MCB9825929.1 leucine--tRNA ligase [Planctomycetota bacterium]MCB9830498.1 leucine--tRNA ligase [Planctomycetota bacterium]MCB9900733.1 leucine--tRNA ligase [Planctomycetota bacterium]
MSGGREEGGYEPAAIEPRWRERWEEAGTNRARGDGRPKRYILDMFPYPSGAGLHMGHAEIYTISDVIARHARLQGFDVLHPTGWDAFGLPAEQYAIRHGVHPRTAVDRNVATFKGQMERMGWSYDWSREIDTTDPEYYRWTQWIFRVLYERGLAYEADVPVNWCEALGTVLANEEVIDGKSERGGHPVVQRPMRQWLLRITSYAQRLLDDLELVDWPESLKEMQRQWIGRSEGAEVTFAIDGHDDSFTVFTTRPDTLYGATYCALAPEHPLVATVTTPEQAEAVTAYVERAARRSERERMADVHEKTGVFTGAYAINPVNGERLPIWVADYVLMGYGTGAVMAVPGHDQRDHDFARAFDLPIREVVSGGDVTEAAFEGDGPHVSSGPLDGQDTPTAKRTVIALLEKAGQGRARITYKLRDWLFSRQRYWGEPFPIIHRADGETVLLGEDALPITLPQVARYEPTGTGESPLAGITEWVETTDPRDGSPARRETNTMPQWAGSCWYYLRYISPHCAERFVDESAEKAWMPVDVYVGGVEHAVLHLLYARFWHKVLFDAGLVSTPEPFQRLVNQGMITAPAYKRIEADASSTSRYIPPAEVTRRSDGTWVHRESGETVERVVMKMSKSAFNVANPDDLVEQYGADALRLYILFMGPPEDDKVWDHAGIHGITRFLHRLWRLVVGDSHGPAKPRSAAPAEGEARRLLHGTIAGMTRDMEQMAYNTAISKLMVMLNGMGELDAVPEEMLAAYLPMLSPFAPHVADELWSRLAETSDRFAGWASTAAWPTYDEAALVADEVELAVQVNGKVRGRLTVAADASEESILTDALALEGVVRALEGMQVTQRRVVPGRLVVLGAKPEPS